MNGCDPWQLQSVWKYVKTVRHVSDTLPPTASAQPTPVYAAAGSAGKGGAIPQSIQSLSTAASHDDARPSRTSNHTQRFSAFTASAFGVVSEESSAALDVDHDNFAPRFVTLHSHAGAQQSPDTSPGLFR